MNSQSNPADASTSADAALASVTIVPSSVSPRLRRSRNACAISAMIGDDLAALHDDRDIHQIEDQLQRVAVDNREIRDVARRDRPELVVIDERRGIWTHELDDVARREHQVQRL